MKGQLRSGRNNEKKGEKEREKERRLNLVNPGDQSFSIRRQFRISDRFFIRKIYYLNWMKLENL